MKMLEVVDKIQNFADTAFEYSYLAQFLFKITKCSVTYVTQFRYVHYRVNLLPLFQHLITKNLQKLISELSNTSRV